MTMNSDEDNNDTIVNAKLLSQLPKELFEYDDDGDSTKPTATINNPNMTVTTDVSVSSNSNSSSSNSVGVATMVVGASFLGLLGIQFPFLFIKNAPYMATPSRKVRNALLHLLRERRRDIVQNSSTCTVNGTSLTSKTVATTRLSMPSLFPASSSSSLSSSSLSSSSTPSRPLSQNTSLPIFIDLGSGDGHSVYEAAKLGYQSFGIELNWTLWAFSSLRRHLFWSADIKQRSQFIRQDFLHYNLRTHHSQCTSSVNTDNTNTNSNTNTNTSNSNNNSVTIMIFGVPRTMPLLGQKIQKECLIGTNILSYRFGIPLAPANMSSQTQTILQNEKDTSTNNKEQRGRKNSNTTTTTTTTCSSEGGEIRQLQANCIYDQEEMKIYRMVP